MGRLAGKVAIISGGARGLGAEEVKAFAREGGKVVFGDILDAQGKALEADIRKTGGEATYVHLDVTAGGRLAKRRRDRGRALRPARHSRQQCRHQQSPRGQSKSGRPKTGIAVMAVNVKGVFLGTKYSIPAMRQAGGGSIVNIVSIAALGQSSIQDLRLRDEQGSGPYLQQGHRKPVREDKIRCNSLYPGPTDTGMLRTFLPDPQALEKRLQRVPLGRLGTPEEIVAGVLFLASDESSFATGTELVIDGGALAD